MKKTLLSCAIVGGLAVGSPAFAASIDDLIQQANQGDIGAQRDLGRAYLTGHGAPKNVPYGIAWLQQAADGNDAQANYLLGSYYLTLRQTEHNERLGRDHLARATVANYLPARAKLGRFILDRADNAPDAAARQRLLSQAEKLLDSAAEYGDPSAIDTLAQAYGNGTFGPNREADVRRQWERAARIGDAGAAWRIASEILSADSRNEVGLQWLQRAANGGQPDAVRDITRRLIQGDGVAQNLDLADAWAQRARDLRVPSLTVLVGELKAAQAQAREEAAIATSLAGLPMETPASATRIAPVTPPAPPAPAIDVPTHAVASAALVAATESAGQHAGSAITAPLVASTPAVVIEELVTPGNARPIMPAPIATSPVVRTVAAPVTMPIERVQPVLAAITTGDPLFRRPPSVLPDEPTAGYAGADVPLPSLKAAPGGMDPAVADALATLRHEVNQLKAGEQRYTATIAERDRKISMLEAENLRHAETIARLEQQLANAQGNPLPGTTSRVAVAPQAPVQLAEINQARAQAEAVAGKGIPLIQPGEDDNRLGLVAVKAKDYPTAVRHFQNAALAGNALATNNLAMAYLNGSGVTQDETKALSLFKLAADRGSGTAANNVGWMFHHGLGVAVNLDEAARWYRRAIALGNVDSQDALARVMKANGTSIAGG